MNEGNRSSPEATQAAIPADTPKPAASCVKFTQDEYRRVSEDARQAQKSIPALLKLAYFSQKRVTILMNKTDQERWFRELRYWGNNLNQVAKRVNSGVMAGWYQEIRQIQIALMRIEHKVLGVHGHS